MAHKDGRSLHVAPGVPGIEERRKGRHLHERRQPLKGPLRLRPGNDCIQGCGGRTHGLPHHNTARQRCQHVHSQTPLQALARMHQDLQTDAVREGCLHDHRFVSLLELEV